MKHANPTTRSKRSAMFALFARSIGVVVASALLVVASQAAPPTQPPAAPGQAASPSTVKQASHETPTVGLPAPKTSAARSTNAGKTPMRAGGLGAQSSTGASGAAAPTAGSSFIAVMSSLAIVIGLLFMVLWVMRRAMPGAARKLPADVLDVLGYMPLGNRQQAQLLRLGNKLLLVNVTATGAETLSEVTDSDEVERLTKLSRQPVAATPTANFRQILQQFERKPATVTSSAKRLTPAAATSSTGQEQARG